MGKRNRQQIVELKVVEYSKRGNGIGYFDREDKTRWKVEVPFTIPGDSVRVLVMRKRSGIYTSRLEEIIEYSPDRVEPRCVHFGQCGGCRWQQIPYEMQLHNKEAIVRRCFDELITKETDVRPILPCDKIWHYRNKMEYSFHSDAANNHYLGLIMDSTKGKVFHLTECHLPNPWFVDALTAVREWWNEFGLDAYHSRTNTGSLRTLILREGQRTGDRMVILTVSGNPDYALSRHHIEGYVAFVRDAVEPVEPEKKLGIFLRIHQVKKGTPTNIYDMHLYGSDHIREILNIKPEPSQQATAMTFKISPQAFFQPNTQQAEELYSIAIRMTMIPKDATVFDLYCGTGVLGICAAKRARQVVGIELSTEAAEDARINVEQNGLSNVDIHAGDVSDVLSRIKEEELYPSPDVVMVDPPRAGLEPKALQHLLEWKPSKILYVSCNPVTQAENIKTLVENGYRIEAMQPVDQFPHTVHIENVVVLTKR